MTTRTLARAQATDTARPGYAAFALVPRHDAGGARQRIGAGPTARELPVAVSAAASDSAMMMNALHAYAFGVVICDQSSHVAFANAAAETLAREGVAILLNRGQLSALARAEACGLAGLIRDAATDGAGGAIQLTGRDGETILALVTPLPRQPDQHHAGRALVSLRATDDRLTLSAGALAAMFRLTPSQASIALAIFEGKAPEKIALERGVRISTLRSQLAEIFARTGTEDQRDLVRLLGLLPPLAAAAATARGSYGIIGDEGSGAARQD